jgi:pilus assembly protein CpaF
MSENGNPKRLKLYKDKMGERHYTLASLRERIEDQFHEETSGRPDILGELDTREKRIEAVTEAADYVLATEYVNLPAREKHQIIEEAVANIFYFGPLDDYLRDPTITEMTFEGPFDAHVRSGFSEPKKLASPFDDVKHLERIVTAMIAPSGAALSDEQPFLEVGLTLHQRRVRLSIIAPPISVLYSMQLRLHPVNAFTLHDLIPGMIPQPAADLMLDSLQSGRGMIVTGEVGVAKTTLITALLNALPQKTGIVVVERAAEMALSDGITRLAAIPRSPFDESVERDFAAQVGEAIQHHNPTMLVLDEVRGDESEGLWEALSAQSITQTVIAFRGSSNPGRLLSALGMAIRKRQFGLESETINAAILQKMPLVAALHRFGPDAPPRLSLLGQWVAADDGSLTLQPLVTWGADGDPVRHNA